MLSLFSAQEAFITMNSLKILKYSKMRRADLQENLSLCYNLFRRERKGYLYAHVGERERGLRRGSIPRGNTNTISQWKCECENIVSVFFLIFVQVPSVYKGRRILII